MSEFDLAIRFASILALALGGLLILLAAVATFAAWYSRRRAFMTLVNPPRIRESIILRRAR